MNTKYFSPIDISMQSCTSHSSASSAQRGDVNISFKLPDERKQNISATLANMARLQAQKVIEKIPLLGSVSWLMMQQTSVRHTLMSELDWRVMPPLMLDQCKVYMRNGAPFAYVSWARLSETVAQRYRQAPHHLAATDWSSGEHIWLVDMVTPFGGLRDVLDDIRENIFPGETVAQFQANGAGTVNAHVWPPYSESSVQR